MKNLKFWAIAALSTALVFITFYGAIATIDERLKARYPETTETEMQTVKETETEIIFTPIETEVVYDTETENQNIPAQQSDEEISESREEVQPVTVEVSEFYTQTYDETLNESSSRQVNYDDLILLAKIITNEAGMDFATDEHQRAVASVVLNRVADPRFPNTVYDVLMAGWYDGGPIQYGFGSPEKFFALEPSQRAIDNARYVLTYGSTVGDAVWQAEFIQGEVVAYFDYHMAGLLPTYICR